ncbi:hypothetical protein [Streptomyces sp. NPDC003077]|uniref:hypothetical protein n=1 Tax=Streptomyces sp. NPDC003077 TaxID=3154443 RepID=UPI0033AE2E63
MPRLRRARHPHPGRLRRGCAVLSRHRAAFALAAGLLLAATYLLLVRPLLVLSTR